MRVFRTTVFIAAVVGVLAGIVMTALQTTLTVPLILKAEVYEKAIEQAAPATKAAPSASAAHQHAPGTPAHDHAGDAWEPADGLERTLYTALANIVTAIGFALLLVSASEFAGGITQWRQGLIWGLGGFATFTLAPGLGLPPELPAMPAAELLARQIWWVGTVAATAAGLALIAFRRSVLFAIIGVALIVAPHLIGAPQPTSHDSPIPSDLHQRFVIAVTLTNLVFWLVLGVAIPWVRARFARGLAAPADSLA